MSDREREHATRVLEQFTKQAEPFARFAIHTQASSLELLRDALRLSGRERLLDAGCGPGLLLRYFAPMVSEVVGLDATPAMLHKAREVLREAGITNVSTQHGDMEQLPFADASFDAVVTRYTFHHLLRPERAFEELVRVCKPGGRVVVCDATPRPDARAAYDAWELVRDPSHASARTEQELASLADAHLVSTHLMRFRLESVVEDLLASCFPTDRAALYRRMADDVGVNALDMAAQLRGDTLMMAFPISVIAGNKPAVSARM
ncbi:MAG: class I SAM-dependent methyltransferase [Myxococcales bacterium]